jgi:hypothetical protein
MLVLGDLILTRRGDDPKVVYARTLGTIAEIRPLLGGYLTDLHRPQLLRSGSVELEQGRICKSHHLEELFARRNHRIVYVFREPASAMLSYFHFACRDAPEYSQHGLEAFARIRLLEWLDHVTMALRFHLAFPDQMLLLEYGATTPLSADQILRAACHLNLPCTPVDAEAARERLATTLDTLNTRSNQAHPRGCNRGIAEAFSQDLLEEIHRIASPVYEAARKMAARQRTEMTAM